MRFMSADKAFVTASATAKRPDALGFKVATGVLSPMDIASP